MKESSKQMKSSVRAFATAEEFVLTKPELSMKRTGNYGNRKGIKDIWNAFMVKGAQFTEKTDIPFCPTTASALPKAMITYAEAEAIYNRQMESKNKKFFVDAFVCFYLDDYKFDGRDGIWFNPWRALDIIRHFAGIITPDFSTCVDFPDPLLRWNTYRMRAFGYWCGKKGTAVINNVRWGFEETFEYCCDGIPKNSIICIGSVASGLKRLKGQENFAKYFFRMIEILQPKTVLVYGGAKKRFFDMLRMMDIEVAAYPSRRNRKR